MSQELRTAAREGGARGREAFVRRLGRYLNCDSGC